MATTNYVLHLIASAPSHGDRHVNPDSTARELGRYESFESADAAGKTYLREHPDAWLQIQSDEAGGSIDDVTP